MKGGAFIVVALVLVLQALGYNVSRQGSAKRSQLLALAMTVCLLSFWLPSTSAGFISKFYYSTVVLQAGVAGETLTIALVAGVLNSALSLYYYLKVIRFMYSYMNLKSQMMLIDFNKIYITFRYLVLVLISPTILSNILFSLYMLQRTVLCD